MNRSCRCASTWAGVSTTVAIMKMLELSVNVRPDETSRGVTAGSIRHTFMTCTYTTLNTGNLNKPLSKSSIPLKAHTSFSSSHLCLPCWAVQLQCITGVLWGGGSPESIKNTVHESRHISVTGPNFTSKAHTDSALLSTSLVSGCDYTTYVPLQQFLIICPE